MGNGQKSVIDHGRRLRDNYSDVERKKISEYQQEWYHNNKDEMNKKYRKLGTACDIIRKHHEDMKDDPESLDIRKMMDIDCED